MTLLSSPSIHYTVNFVATSRVLGHADLVVPLALGEREHSLYERNDEAQKRKSTLMVSRLLLLQQVDNHHDVKVRTKNVRCDAKNRRKDVFYEEGKNTIDGSSFYVAVENLSR